jgi:biopolymer transport protein ExbD
MPFKQTQIEEPGLNLTPMIDIVLLLVIFFMVGTQFTEAERQYEIELPTVSSAQPLTGLPDEIVINVARDGRLFLGSQQKSFDEIQEELKAAKARYADQGVLIRGDGQVAYQYVMDVLAVCQRFGIVNVSLANRIEEAGP